MNPIAVFYEHPEWFRPLFAELDRRNIPYVKRHARQTVYDPGKMPRSYSLVVNRVSAYPSNTGHPQIVFFVRDYLSYLETIGTPVINGANAYLVGISKAMQMGIFSRLNLFFPETRMISEPPQALAAAEEIGFPLMMKPNIGGSGAGIQRFGTMAELEAAVKSESFGLGIDGVGMVQAYIAPEGKCIYRIEILDGKFLYAIRLPVLDDNFNYCPADGCNVAFNYCPLDGGQNKDTDTSDNTISAFDPPAEAIEEVKRVIAASDADIGGVEYLVGPDKKRCYYDINPLSNFVANAVEVVGFDPVSVFVDYILDRAGMTPEMRFG